MLPESSKNAIEIKVHPCQKDNNNLVVDPRVFPKRCFGIIYGSRMTGKTILLTNLIKDFYLPKNSFQSIIILTPSVCDPGWNLIRKRKRVVMSNRCSNDLLFDILEEQERRLKDGTCKDILIVIDDFASQGRALKALAEISIRGRHPKITVIITTQYANLLPPVIRRNATCVLLFKMGDEEIRNLGKEGLRCLEDIDEFTNWVKKHTKIPRSFVYINLRDSERPFRIGFSD